MATDTPACDLPRQRKPHPAQPSRARTRLDHLHDFMIGANRASAADLLDSRLTTDDDLLAGGVIRKLWLGDTALYRDHLLRLDRKSRHARFAGTVSDQFIRDHVNVAISTADVIDGFFVDGVLRAAAELQPVPSGSDDDAEVSFSVEQPWQGQGVGSALLARTLVAARNRGIRRLHMMCLADNRRMQQLAGKFGAELKFESGSIIGEIVAPEPTPLSMMREMVADAYGFATAILDVQAGLLRLWGRLASAGTMRSACDSASAAREGRGIDEHLNSNLHS